MSDKPSIRCRVSGNYRGANAGSWEINGWLDAARASTAILRACGDKKNELVTLVTEHRLPSGRWGRRSVVTYRVNA
jgi:hypothetical protein